MSVILISLTLMCAEEANASSSKWHARVLTDRVSVYESDNLVTEYRFSGFSRPIFYPLLTKNAEPVTRAWPIEDSRPGESKDHPHQLSLWYAHGDVNGVDFWTEHEGAGRIVHKNLSDLSVDENGVSFSSMNHWVTHDGKTLLDESRSTRVGGDSKGRFIDLEITLHSEEDLIFGDTKEGTLGVRVRAELRLNGDVASGRIRNSEGVSGKAAWGKRARWVDYSIENLEGAQKPPVGLCAFDHSENPRFPTHWHARDYGLLAANPFGISDFESLKVKGSGRWILAKGEKSTWRYRVYFYDGAMSSDELQRMSQTWSLNSDSQPTKHP